MIPDTTSPLLNVNLHDTLQQLIHSAVRFGFKIFFALIVLSLGMWLSGRLTKLVKRGMERRRLEPSLQSFLSSFVNIITKVFVFVVVLATIGVQMTAITAALGAGALAIGMALSGTLQNVAGGFVILLFKPFKVGDTIVLADEKSGIVKKIMIFTTEITTFDNKVIVLPNSVLSGGVVTNLSRGGSRRSDITVGISYGNSVDIARKTILDILKKDSRVLDAPSAPSVFISDLADSAVVLTVRFWTSYEDMLAVVADVREQIYNALPKKKVNFPFPQMDVHIIK